MFKYLLLTIIFTTNPHKMKISEDLKPLFSLESDVDAACFVLKQITSRLEEKGFLKKRHVKTVQILLAPYFEQPEPSREDTRQRFLETAPAIGSLQYSNYVNYINALYLDNKERIEECQAFMRRKHI